VRIPYKSLAAIGAVAAGTAAVNTLIGQRTGLLENRIGGRERMYKWRYGDIFYTTSGGGEPILFIHGIGAGASSFEWRRNFLPLADHYNVYALDLLGFGLSDKPPVEYNAEMYVQMIAEFILDVIGQPSHVAASSHGAAYAVAAAVRHKPMIKSLILSCPTGIGVAETSSSIAPGLSALLRVPIIGTSVYYGLTSRSSIKSYLESKIYFDSAEVTTTVVDQYYAAAHQPGAERAVRAFMSGALNIDITQEFKELTQPAALVWGKEAKLTPVEVADRFIAINSGVRLDILPISGQLPHVERSDAYNAVIRDVTSRPPEGATAPPHKHTSL